MTLWSGDVVVLDLGIPKGREAGFPRPAVLVTAQRILDESPSVVQVVPLTSTIRHFESEILVKAGSVNGLTESSAAQCQHIRAISHQRIRSVRGNVGSTVLAQLRETIATLLDVAE